MAAFENVSRLTIRPHDRESLIDIRSAKLPSVISLSNDFDPHLHRDPRTPIRSWMAYFNLVRTGLGAGVLGVPLAISQVGMVLGPLLLFFTSFLVIHTHLTLIWVPYGVTARAAHFQELRGARTVSTYMYFTSPSDLVPINMLGSTIIATFMILSQLGICTVFVIFTSDSLRDIMDWQDSKPALMSLLVPYLLLEFFMKNLKIVSYVSMTGLLMNMIGLAVIFYHIFKEPHGEVSSATLEALPVLFAFGTFLFNLSAVGVILALDKALVNPKLMIEHFGVVKVGIMVPTVIVTVFGTLGYWSFGVMEENVLRSLPFDDYTSMVSIGLYMIAIALAYPIQCYPVIQIILEIIKNRNTAEEPSEQTMKTIEFIIRPLFVLSSFAVAYMVPFQGPFVAFVGNVCTTMLALVFPAMMEISLMYPGPYGNYNVLLIKNVIIILLGLTSWVFGAVLCGYLIYVRIMSSYSPNNIDYFR